MPRRRDYKLPPSGVRLFEEGFEEGYADGFRAGIEYASTVKAVPKQAARLVPGNPHPKKRRKTKYQAAYGAAYKRLKKKHPRMSFGSLSKKAHAAARKKVK